MTSDLGLEVGRQQNEASFRRDPTQHPWGLSLEGEDELGIRYRTKNEALYDLKVRARESRQASGVFFLTEYKYDTIADVLDVTDFLEFSLEEAANRDSANAHLGNKWEIVYGPAEEVERFSKFANEMVQGLWKASGLKFISGTVVQSYEGTWVLHRGQIEIEELVEE